MKIKKAVTFRASSIGDCLMGKYFLENVHAAYPKAKCAMVVGSRSAMIRDLCVAYPWLEIIEVNRRNPVSIMRLLWQWWNSDLVLTQYAGKEGGRFSLASKYIGRLLACRGGFIGFADTFPWNKYLYDKILQFSRNAAPAMLERQALSELTIPIAFPTPSLSFSQDTSLLQRIGVQSGRYAVVHLFAGNKGRGLAPKNQRALLSAFHEQLPGLTLLVSGGEQDEVQAEEVCKGIPDTRNIAGGTSLQEMLQIIDSAAGVVSVDTGMAHIAAQLKKPLIVLCSCLGLHWWQEEQYGRKTSLQIFTFTEPNGHVFKEYPDCLNNIDMKNAARAAQNLFSSTTFS